MLAACAGPAPLARWEGCVLDGAQLVDGPVDGAVVVEAGEGRVLDLRDRWGGLPLVTDSGGYGWLAVELPESGDLAGAPSIYREGGQILTYEARGLSGRIDAEALDRDRTRVRLEAVAQPTLDRDGRGTTRLEADWVLGRIDGTRCP